MSEGQVSDEKMIEMFHMMWDGFPGLARLIDKKHMILAANQTAIAAGFEPGLCCAKVSTAENHRGCLAGQLLQTGIGQTDRRTENKIRGWIPVKGREDLFVHYTLVLPEVESFD